MTARITATAPRIFGPLGALVQRFVDTEGIPQNDVLTYGLIYNALAPGDYEGPISIRMIRDFLETVKEKDPKSYQRLINVYDLQVEVKNEKRERSWAESYLDTFRSVENAYQYSLRTKEAIDKMAPKLDAPEDMSPVERAKWLRMWIIVVKEQSYFWFDYTDGGKRFDFITSKQSDGNHFFPEVLVNLERVYFSKLKDGEIVYELLKAFVDNLPKEAQKAIIRFSEFERNEPDSLMVQRVRENVKKLVFPVNWVCSSAYFFTKEFISNIAPNILSDAVITWKNGNLQELKTIETPYVDFLKNYKTRIAKAYCFSEEAQAYVRNELELRMHVAVYEWLKKHSDFEFGNGPDEEKATLSQYGMDDLLDEDVPSFENCIRIWINEMNFVESEDDINWDVVYKIFDKDLDEVSLGRYFRGELTAHDIFERTFLRDYEQARSCINTALPLPKTEKKKMGDSLTRIQNHTELPHDRIYFSLFSTMLSSRREELPNQYVRIYENIVNNA